MSFFLSGYQKKAVCLVSFFVIGMIVLNFWLDLNKEEIFFRTDDIFKKNPIIVSLEQEAGAFFGSSLVFSADVSEEINDFLDEELRKILGVRPEVNFIR